MAELVVAMVIITIVLLVLMVVQTSSLLTIAEAGRRQQATAFLNQTIEQMRSMPWNTLSKGLPANFASAAGGDPFVSGTTVSVNGDSYTLLLAPASGPGSHDLSDPDAVWEPLFDSSGSNFAVNSSPEVPGIDFETRAYTVEGPEAGSIGLLAIVSWTNLDTQETQSMHVYTVAFAPSGGCGDLDLQPFLSSCQARFTASASSGTIVVNADGTVSEDDATPRSIIPGSGFREWLLVTSEARASVASQQITIVDSELIYGGEEARREDGTSWSSLYPRGFGSTTAEADDLPSTATPASNVSLAPNAVAPGTAVITSYSVPDMSYSFQSDHPSGTLTASITAACPLGTPAGQACAQATLDGGQLALGRFNIKESTSTNFTLTPFSRGSSTTETWSNAWVGRFVDATLGTACGTLTDEGCVAAGAAKKSDTIGFGVPGGSTTWTDGTNAGATQGIVYITGYTDSVQVERGKNQKTATPTVSRAGTLYYWNGSSYQTVDLDEGNSASLDSSDIPILDWSSAGGKMKATAETSVQVLGGVAPVVEGTDPTCLTDVCKVSQSAGTIIVTIAYTLEINGGNDRVVTFTTVINGSQAAASYQATKDS